MESGSCGCCVLEVPMLQENQAWSPEKALDTGLESVPILDSNRIYVIYNP